MAKKKSPVLRLFVAMLIGLFVIETMIELTTGTTLIGGRNGIFVSRPHSNLKTVNTPMKESGRTTRETDIHEFPDLNSMKVGSIKVDTSLRIIGKTTVGKEAWYQLQRFGGKIGYVYAGDVKIK
ncbi:MAG: SH3 domain-containing protein [Rhodospirillales bacterium]|nr:SH3 domain-containing protein [Rhodospirillales bacterium]